MSSTRVKTTLEYDPKKLERVKQALGTSTLTGSVDEAWDIILGMRGQKETIRSMIADPLDSAQAQGPGIVLDPGYRQ